MLSGPYVRAPKKLVAHPTASSYRGNQTFVIGFMMVGVNGPKNCGRCAGVLR